MRGGSVLEQQAFEAQAAQAGMCMGAWEQLGNGHHGAGVATGPWGVTKTKASQAYGPDSMVQPGADARKSSLMTYPLTRRLKPS